MSYKVRLTRINSNHDALRTDTIEGVTYELPTKDSRFHVVGESLTPVAPGMNTVRVVATTEVQNVEQINNEYVFNTLNSLYKLEVLEEIP